MKHTKWYKIAALSALILYCTQGVQAYAVQRGDTVSVYFPFNESQLTIRAQDMLDSLSYNEVLTPDKDLMIVGYADFPGTNNYNDVLSQKRATAVAAYLKTLGFRQSNIQLCTGKGELEHTSEDTEKGYAPDRRVDIVLLHRKRKPAEIQPPQAITATKEKPVTSKPSLRTVTVQPAIVLPSLSGITELQPDRTIRLNNIYFPSGRHFVTQNSQQQLDELYDVLSKNPGLRIRIEGHVCCIYDYADAFDEDTQTNHLSVNRARFIYEYLVHKGINASRLEYAGFGRSRPVVFIEHNEEEAQQNRRVEVRILSH